MTDREATRSMKIIPAIVSFALGSTWVCLCAFTSDSLFGFVVKIIGSFVGFILLCLVFGLCRAAHDADEVHDRQIESFRQRTPTPPVNAISGPPAPSGGE